MKMIDIRQKNRLNLTKLKKVELNGIKVNSRAKVEHLETNWTVIRIIVASPGQ